MLKWCTRILGTITALVNYRTWRLRDLTDIFNTSFFFLRFIPLAYFGAYIAGVPVKQEVLSRYSLYKPQKNTVCRIHTRRSIPGNIGIPWDGQG